MSLNYDPLQSNGPPPRREDQPPPPPAKEAAAPSIGPWSSGSPLAQTPNLSTVPPRGLLGSSQTPHRLEQPVASTSNGVPPLRNEQPGLIAAPTAAARPVSPGEPRSPYARPPARPLTPDPADKARRVQVERPVDVPAVVQRPVGSEYLQVRIHGFDRTKKEVWVKMDAATNLSSFHTAHVKPFSRSFAEFLNLHSALAGAHPEAILPALPLVQTSAATDEEEDRVVKAAFQRYIDRIVRNPDLMRDDELRIFVEANFGYTPLSTRRRAVPAASALAKFRRSALEENDELGRAKSELMKLEAALIDASRASEKECTSRRALAVALNTLSEQLAAFSTTEAHRPLANGLRRFGDGMRRSSELINGESTAEGVTLADGLAYEAAEAKEGKETLMQRQGTVDDYRAAVKTTVSKQRQVERLKGGSNIKRDRADEALDELDEAQKVEASLTQQLQAISTKLAPSVRQHSHQLHQDLLQILSDHGQACLRFERQILRDLETLQPEMQGIPSRTGGEITYKHSDAVPGQSVPNSPVSQRTLSLPRSSSDRDSLSRDRAAMSRSVIVPPTHGIAASMGPGGRVKELAASVYVTGGDQRGRIGEKIADERQRVDARMAASKLAFRPG